MPCGCKKKKTEEVKVTPMQVTIVENGFQKESPSPTLTPEQKEKVDLIVEKINFLNKN